jgi:hypothetical protein
MKKLRTILYFFLGIFIIVGCEKESCISGNGQIISKTYNISSLTGLSVSSKADIEITIGEPGLTIKGESNILSVLNVEERGNTIIIGEDNCFKKMETLKVYFSIPKLTHIETSGICNVVCEDTITSENFSLNLSGNSDIDLTLESTEINTISSGECMALLKGNSESQEITISGLGEFNCFGLKSKAATIILSGQADIEVYAEDALDVTISGKGNVYYKGTPSIKQEISGGGKIIDANE